MNSIDKSLESKSIKMISNSICVGCGACYAVCPKQAIDMVEDKEGFKVPAVNEEKCIQCGLCLKACPVVEDFVSRNEKRPETYAVMASDSARKDSTSGGVFYVFAQEFLKNDDYVAGAIWNDDCTVKHIVSNKEPDIQKMRKSKYLQSNTSECYKRVKILLENGKNVLFSGTPCQIAGLRKYLSADYENLHCVDIICHGVPSPKFFQQYVKNVVCKNPAETWLNTDFRDKRFGWSLSPTIVTRTTSGEKLSYDSDDFFMNNFLYNKCLRKSCGNCKFNRLPRQGDLTIGDFWGIEKVSKKIDDKKGTSVVLINNNKGQKLFDKVEKEFKFIQKTSLKIAKKKNPNIVKSSKVNLNLREIFFNHFNNTQFDDNCDCMILNFARCHNYGAVLTCFGVQCLVEMLGYKARVINYAPSSEFLSNDNPFGKFAAKYLKLTVPVNNYADFLNLNSKCKSFIVGPDQVWNYRLFAEYKAATKSVYTLDFVDNKNKKIAYAASFGTDVFLGDKKEKELFKHFINDFDAISVREQSGVDILDNEFGVNSVQLIDGAFHIPRQTLDELTCGIKSENKYIATQFFFKKRKGAKYVIDAIGSKLNLPVKEFNIGSSSVNEWLAFIKNSSFVISDSYHMIVFAIIFNIPFIQIKNTSTQARFETLFDTLGLENNSVERNADSVDVDLLLKPIDWKLVNSKIDFEISRSRKWLEETLSGNFTRPLIENNISYLLNNGQLFTHEEAKLINNKEELKRKYLFAKMRILFAIGKTRNKYIKKLQLIKSKVKRIKAIEAQLKI